MLTNNLYDVLSKIQRFLPANRNIRLGFRFESNGEISVINNTGAVISGAAYCNRNVCYFI